MATDVWLIGARYLLDSWHKHAPTLHDRPAPRLELLRRAVRIGADLDAEAVSFWAGIRPGTVDPRPAWRRLVRGCATLVSTSRPSWPAPATTAWSRSSCPATAHAAPTVAAESIKFRQSAKREVYR